MTTKTHPVLSSEEYGIVVDLLAVEEPDPIEKAIEEIHSPLVVSLQLTASQRTRLTRLAEDANQSLEDYVSSVVLDDLQQRVGRPNITGPSKLAHQSINGIGSIKGPIGGMVTRG